VVLSFFTLICLFRRELARNYPVSCSNFAIPGIVDAPSLCLVLQSTSRQIPIGQCTGREQGIGIIVQPAVADLGKAKHALDHRKDMLHPGPDFDLVRLRLLAASSGG